MTTTRLLMGAAGLLGALGVAMGAYAAHGLEPAFGPEAAERATLGARYQVLHALALFAAAYAANGFTRRRAGLLAAALFLAGGVLFPGALYLLALGGPAAAGAVAPIGGLSLILGWLALGWAGLGGRSADSDLESGAESP